jgi:hypothetical protein
MANIIPCDRCDIGLLPHELDNGHCPECGSLLGEKTGLSRAERLREYKRQYWLRKKAD